MAQHCANYRVQITKKGMDVPPFVTEEHSPLKDLRNTSMDGSANLKDNQTNNPNTNDTKRKSVQSWYGRMSDEKKAEYNMKRRISRQQKKVATLDCASQDQFSQKFVSLLRIVQPTPFSDIINTHTKGTCVTSTASISANTPQMHTSDTCVTSAAPISANTPQTPASAGASANKQGGKTWYANLSDEKKAEHLRKLRMAREQKRTAALVLNVDVPQSSTQQGDL
uniref:Uncharacterized protein n=1 Tax=Triticum urartu TaxID=4572 RepID=A0A8R7Q305_TRIUA